MLIIKKDISVVVIDKIYLLELINLVLYYIKIIIKYYKNKYYNII